MEKQKISIRNESEIRVTLVENILAVTVKDYLCTFFIENESPFSCTKSLKEVETMLPDFFIRINRNCIINTDKVKSISRTNKSVQIQGNMTFSVSVRGAKRLKRQYA